MRHLKRVKKFNKSRSHVKAMFSNMVISFFQYERIKTTTAKAKELRRLVEKMITRAKENTLHNKRIILGKIKDRDVVAKLFDEIAPRYKNVNGGYTRIIKLANRMGDGAELSLLELVELKAPPKATPKAKKKEEVKEEK
jgi:large subunit ribosomal protein L17